MKKLRLGSFHKKAVTDFNEKGFTLIELMIVIAIIAILSASIYVFFNSISAKSTAERTVAITQQQARSTLDMIARDIRMLGLDPTGTGTPGLWTGSAKGNNPLHENYMAFSADLNYDGDVLDPFERIAYYVDDGGQLIMETFVLQSGANATNLNAPVTRELFVMLTGLGVTDLKFNYYNSSGNIITANSAANNNGDSLFSVEIELTVRTDSLEGQIARTYSTQVRLRNK